MTGEKQILEARARGQRLPGNAIWVKVDAQAKPWPMTEAGDHAEVCISPSDYVSLLDLRFAAGLTILVEGCDSIRVDEVAKAFGKARAARVIATTFSNDMRPQVLRATDTEGALTWPM